MVAVIVDRSTFRLLAHPLFALHAPDPLAATSYSTGLQLGMNARAAIGLAALLMNRPNLLTRC